MRNIPCSEDLEKLVRKIVKEVGLTGDQEYRLTALLLDTCNVSRLPAEIYGPLLDRSYLLSRTFQPLFTMWESREGLDKLSGRVCYTLIL